MPTVENGQLLKLVALFYDLSCQYHFLKPRVLLLRDFVSFSKHLCRFLIEFPSEWEVNRNKKKQTKQNRTEQNMDNCKIINTQLVTNRKKSTVLIFLKTKENLCCLATLAKVHFPVVFITKWKAGCSQADALCVTFWSGRHSRPISRYLFFSIPRVVCCGYSSRSWKLSVSLIFAANSLGHSSWLREVTVSVWICNRLSKVCSHCFFSSRFSTAKA